MSENRSPWTGEAHRHPQTGNALYVFALPN